MGRARYQRILEKVREAVAAEKVRSPSFPSLHIRDVAEKLGVKESVVNQACSVLQKEGLLSQWRGRGYYGIVTPRNPLLDWDDLPEQKPPPPPKVSWGSKRRLLALIRSKKPWVVEKWDEKRQRWFMYMERKCADPRAHKTGSQCSQYLVVAPEDQPDLSRSEIAKWHFTFEGAIQACHDVRQKHPKEVFRTRDTSAGDYIMGVVL